MGKKKKSIVSKRGHRFTVKEENTGRHDSTVQEILDAHFLSARNEVHQYVTLVAGRVAEDLGTELPGDFEAKRNEIVHKIVELVAKELKAYLKLPNS